MKSIDADVVFSSLWRTRHLPGGVQVTARKIYRDGLLCEEVILQQRPLVLAKEHRALQL